MLISAISISSLASQSPVSTAAIDFTRYQISHHKVIDLVLDNLSGVTYNSDSDSLFAVINNPEKIIELDKRGHVLRTISLDNFSDTEGITYIGDQQFAITQERDRNVTLVDIDATTASLDARNFKQFSLNSILKTNAGLEGIAWSSQKGLFLANEHSPSEIIHLPHALISGMPNAAMHYGDIMPKYYSDLPLEDISGLHFVEQSQQLLVLSHESRELLAIDFAGRIHSRFDLDPSFFGFNRQVEQPEGVTMDDQGLVYIVGEPNILLVLSPH
jgi:uncharacterized protein YjiK